MTAIHVFQYKNSIDSRPGNSDTRQLCLRVNEDICNRFTENYTVKYIVYYQANL